MKKTLLIALFALILLCGCASGAAEGDGKIRVVTTIFPEYDWTRQIIGDKTDDVELTLLLDNGVDMHSYQPSADDMVKISTCDLFIYVGGESDDWVKDALAEAVNKDMAVINLIDSLGDSVKEEELAEGMQTEEDTDGEAEYDEHVWLSLRNAATLCEVIAEKLGEIDRANSDIYAANAASYIKKLTSLDSEYQSAVNAAPIKTLLFGDRFPFRYLTDDYGLSYFAAFAGCSAETEASFETIIFLAGKLDELGLNAVLTLESSDGRIADTIIQNTSAKSAEILKLDSLQSTTSKEAEAGETYLSAMERNLEVLKKALGSN